MEQVDFSGLTSDDIGIVKSMINFLREKNKTFLKKADTNLAWHEPLVKARKKELYSGKADIVDVTDDSVGDIKRLAQEMKGREDA